MFSPQSRYFRGVVASTILGLTVFESGCYEYSQVPSAATEAVPGSHLAFSLNDQGRAALSDKLGPAVGRVEGRYTGMVRDAYAIDVYAVETLGAGRSHWVGERIEIPRQFVTGISEKQLSKGKTALVVVGAIAALAALIGSQSLSGSGTPPAEPSSPGGSTATRSPR